MLHQLPIPVIQIGNKTLFLLTPLTLDVGALETCCDAAVRGFLGEETETRRRDHLGMSEGGGGGIVPLNREGTGIGGLEGHLLD